MNSDLVQSTIFCLFQTCDGLHLAEAFLDALADVLADGIAGVTGRTSIDGRVAARVLCVMRRHIVVAQFADEVGGIEASVTAKGDRFGSIGA
jgi:hypothetical protein